MAQFDDAAYIQLTKSLKEFYDLKGLPAQDTVARRELINSLSQTLEDVEKFPQWMQEKSFKIVDPSGHKYPDEKVKHARDYHLNCYMMKAIQHGAMDLVILFAEHDYNPLSTYRFLNVEAKTFNDKVLIRYVAARAAGISDPVKSLDEMNNLCMTMAIFLDRLPSYDSYTTILAQSTSLKALMELDIYQLDPASKVKQEFIPAILAFQELVKMKVKILKGENALIGNYRATFAQSYGGGYATHN